MNSVVLLLKWEVFLWMVTSALNSNEGRLSYDFRRDDADPGKSMESVDSNGVLTYDIRMPGVQPSREDEYICRDWKVPEGELYIVKFEALADGATVHHLILTGCQSTASQSYWSDCHEACHDGQILFAWARNAPPFDLPKDVGFRIGNGTNIKYLTLQVHYKKPFSDASQKDNSGIRVSLTPRRQKYVAGIYLLLVNKLRIPARVQKFHGDVSCYFEDDAVLHPFAFRTHAHSLGRVISGYVYNGSWHLLGKGNPRWPQAFWPMTEHYTIKNGDALVARCTYNASNTNNDTKIGSTHKDEMCNFYIMYYTDPLSGASSYVCVDNNLPDLVSEIPADSDVVLPPNPFLDDLAEGNIDEGKQIDLVSTLSNTSRSDDYFMDNSYPPKGDSEGPGYDRSRLENTRQGRWPANQQRQGNEYRQRNQYLGANKYALWTQYAQGKQYARGNQDAQGNLDESTEEEQEVMEQRFRNQHPYADSVEDENPVIDDQKDASSISIVPSPTITSVPATVMPSAGSSMQLIASAVDSVIRSSLSKLETVDAFTKKMESGGLALGQVSGVAVGDGDTSVCIFHRGSRVWDRDSFDASNNFLHKADGPIKEKTLVKLNASSGDVVAQWANGIFYMPHGLHIDAQGNFWITDVALHQVMMFGPLWPTSDALNKPELVLGVQFEPGSDDVHFCKPTDVVVLRSGEFFVSDGYCNSRILKFSKDGKLVKQWGEHSTSVLGDGFPPPLTFDIPHSITALENRREVCVADRENARVQCFAFDGTFIRQIHPTEFRPKLFALTYSEVTGNLYTVSGPSELDNKAQLKGTTISMEDGKLISTWQPKTSFEHPHDVAVSPDGRYIYVAEIGPNRIWQFKIINNATNFHQSVKKDGVLYHPISDGDEDSEAEDTAVDKMEKKETYFGATIIIGGLIIVPIIIMITVLIFLRLRRKGKQAMGSSHSHNRRFNLGSLLAGSHSSNFVGKDDEQRLELKHLQSDSEVEEYSSVSQQNA